MDRLGSFSCKRNVHEAMGGTEVARAVLIFVIVGTPVSCASVLPGGKTIGELECDSVLFLFLDENDDQLLVRRGQRFI